MVLTVWLIFLSPTIYVCLSVKYNIKSHNHWIVIKTLWEYNHWMVIFIWLVGVSLIQDYSLLENFNVDIISQFYWYWAKTLCGGSWESSSTCALSANWFIEICSKSFFLVESIWAVSEISHNRMDSNDIFNM